MEITDLLDPSGVIPNLRVTSKRQALQELKGQLGDCNVAPPDSLGFGRRFAEIISRLGNVKSVARQKKQKV